MDARACIPSSKILIVLALVLNTLQSPTSIDSEHFIVRLLRVAAASRCLALFSAAEHCSHCFSSRKNSQGWLIQILRSPPAPVRKFFDHYVCVSFCFLSLLLRLLRSGKREKSEICVSFCDHFLLPVDHIVVAFVLIMFLL